MANWLFFAELSAQNADRLGSERRTHRFRNTALEPEISEEKRARAVTRPPFGAVTASASAQNTESAPLADWEKEWIEEVKRRRTQQSED